MKNAEYNPSDFFIFSASGTSDFAFPAFKEQIYSMSRVKNMFKFTNNEKEGNLVLFVKDGYGHKYEAGFEYIYNSLKFIWHL